VAGRAAGDHARQTEAAAYPDRAAWAIALLNHFHRSEITHRKVSAPNRLR
jgi:hypothetical protein